jgi:CheY-like chemotaxis protein
MRASTLHVTARAENSEVEATLRREPRGDKVSTYILVVDDEPDVESMFRQHFRRDLRASRFVMAFANSARAALDQVETIAAPSLILILSDINMPGMSGLEMLAEIKAARPHVPVIMITAYGDDETKKTATKLGAAGLLTKPIDFSLLRQEIDVRLERAS